MENQIIFKTARLNAKLMNDVNSHHIIDLYNHKENIEFIEGIKVEEDIRLSIECYKSYKNMGAYLIFENATNNFIGVGGIQKQETMSDGSFAMPNHDIEFLIIMHKEFNGKGYASEFCTVFFQKLFELFPDLKVPARVNKNNLACIGLLKKFGFKEVGEVDYHVYGNKFALLECCSK